MDSKSSKNYRLNVRIPFSVLETVEQIMEYRAKNGESGITKGAVVTELLKTGARIEKKKAR